MGTELESSRGEVGIRPAAFGKRRLAIALAIAALASVLMAVGWFRVGWAQEEPSCSAQELGILGGAADAQLTASGRWTTEDCDSRYRANSDAHTYRFEVVGGGRIRVDLRSQQADSYLYLLDAEGHRITDNDDGGAGLDARVERDLTPAAYMVEATTVGGRGRGEAEFSLSVSRVTGCDPVHLGTLEPSADLTATGDWTLDTCGSRFVVEHPAHAYLFDLPEGGTVRIDLISDHADPVLSLVSPSAGLIAANDDGGERRNSRIQRYLQAGTYMVEATTYLERDYQPLMADFTLVVRHVDEEAMQESFLLKIEEVHTPAEVIAGQPFPVHYRVGNLGGGDLAEIGGSAIVYVVGPRLFQLLDPITASEDRWQAGVSYHSGSPTASDVSIAVDEVAPLEATLESPGASWVFVGVVTTDAFGDEVGFHGQWQNLMVLSGVTFDAVTVSVDGIEYIVEATSDPEGEVTTTVTPVGDPDAEVAEEIWAKAVYAAGVQTQVLDGILEREGVVDLTVPDESEPVDVESPWSSALSERVATHYINEVASSSLADSLAAREPLNPDAIEDLVLELARNASAQFGYLDESWRGLQDRIEGGETLSFQEALMVHSQFVYAQRVIVPTVRAGEAAAAAHTLSVGWEAQEVQEMLYHLSQGTNCDAREELREGLDKAGATDIEGLLNLDAEMRAAAPIYGVGVDAILCAATGVDAANRNLFESLEIPTESETLQMFGYEEPAASQEVSPPIRLRIIARLVEDGRIEHGVELDSGEQVLPWRRYLSAAAPAGEWLVSSDINVEGSPIGKITSLRLDDGRVRLDFLTASRSVITPDIRYLPADIPTGVWLRSGEIEVPAEPVLDE